MQKKDGICIFTAIAENLEWWSLLISSRRSIILSSVCDQSYITLLYLLWVVGIVAEDPTKKAHTIRLELWNDF